LFSPALLSTRAPPPTHLPDTQRPHCSALSARV
jgi:hypothetical protein